MAKKQRKAKQAKRGKESFLTTFSFNKFLPKKHQFIILPVMLIIFYIIFLLVFSPLYFGGKTFQSGDITTSHSYVTYLEKHDQEKVYTLWNPYVFGGMPAYGIAVDLKPFWYDSVSLIMYTLRKISAFQMPFPINYINYSDEWVFYLILLAFSTFLLLFRRTKNIPISFFTGLATSFCTGMVVFLYIGHITKLTAIWAFPLLLLQLFNFQTKIRLIDFITTVLILWAMTLGWHYQILFYIFFAILIYFIYFFLRSLKLKDKLLAKQLVKSFAILFIAVIAVFLIQTDRFTQIWEYNQFSTRGTESLLEKNTGTTQQSESDFYQYATNWSFSPGEVLTFIVPSFYGFGKSTYQGPLSQNRPVEVNTYFGQMPFVDVAMYMGVIIFFLAVFSMIVNWKDPFVRFFTILSIIALFISFGRTFSPVYDLMFNFFPFFDKFRVPSMILVLVQLSFPILAGLGLVKIISLKDKPDEKISKIVRNSFYVLGGVFIITLLLGSPIKEWFIERATSDAQKGARLKAIHDYMADMFLTDARFAFFFSASTFGLVLAFIKRKLSADFLVILITVLVISDLVRINHRGETDIEKSSIEQLFIKPGYIKAIEDLGDSSVYRVLNLKQDGSIGSLNQNANYLSYFLMYDIYGYSGIKPRAIQDYYDILGSPANPTFWRMLNVKYIIFDKEINSPDLQLVYSGENTFVYLNRSALPRAYFVNRVEQKPAIEIINSVKNSQFDPVDIAFIEEEVPDVEVPDSIAYVKIENFGDELVELEVNASGNNFLFLGDTYMTGETDYKLIKVHTGWKAFIDGNETNIYRANHGFRGIVVPKGKHKIEFVYRPDSFVISQYLSFIFNSIIILGLVIGFALNLGKKFSGKANVE